VAGTKRGPTGLWEIYTDLPKTFPQTYAVKEDTRRKLALEFQTDGNVHRKEEVLPSC